MYETAKYDDYLEEQARELIRITRCTDTSADTVEYCIERIYKTYLVTKEYVYNDIPHFYEFTVKQSGVKAFTYFTEAQRDAINMCPYAKIIVGDEYAEPKALEKPSFKETYGFGVDTKNIPIWVMSPDLCDFETILIDQKKEE